jgi:prefoldin subunit 5
MKINKAVAGMLAAGVLTLGGTGMAYAAPPSSGTATVSTGSAVSSQGGKWCQRAEGRLDGLNKRRVALEARIDKLQKRIANAHAHHREDVAQKLQKRVDSLQKARERVADRIQRIHERCDAGPAASTAGR